MSCTVVFDLAETGYQYWPVLIGGIFMSAISILWIFYRDWVKRLSFRKYPGFIPFMFCGIAISWTLLFVLKTVPTYQAAVKAELAGQGAVVVGTLEIVRDIGNSSSGAHGKVFRINGTLINTRADILQTGFDLSKAYGEIVPPEATMRLTLVGLDVVKAELCGAEK